MFSWILKKWNYYYTIVQLKFGTDVNCPKYQFLHNAAYNHDIDLVKYLIKEQGANVNLVSKDGYVSMYHALKGNNINIANELLIAKAKIDWNAKGFEDLLTESVKNKSFDITKFLVENGADVNRFDSSGSNPIHQAVINKDLESFKYLVDHGAKLDCRYSINKETLLHLAARKNFVECINLLTNKKVDLNIKDMGGNSAIIDALLNNNLTIAKALSKAGAKLDIGVDGPRVMFAMVKVGYLESVKFLLDSGVDINATDAHGFIPLYHSLGNQAVFDFLCNNGANVNFKDAKGTSILHKAVAENRVHSVEKLLSYGASVNSYNANNKTPLYVALKSGYSSMPEILTRYGAAFNLKSITESDLLINAVERNYPDTIKFLMERGFDLDRIDHNGHSAIWYAYKNNNSTVAKALSDSGAKFNAKDSANIELLHHSAKFNHSKVIPLLIKQGVKVDATDSKGHSALYYAIDYRKYDTLKCLLNNGADPNKIDIKSQEFPLYHAVKLNDLAAVKELLSRSSDVDVRDYKSQLTPIFRAIKDGHSEMAKLMINYSSKLDAIDVTTGKTLLQLALTKNLLDLAESIIIKGANAKVLTSDTNESTIHLAIKYCQSKSLGTLIPSLMRAGADATIKNRYGETAEDYAKQCGKSSVISKLIDHSKDLKADDIKVVPVVQVKEVSQPAKVIYKFYNNEPAKDPYEGATAPEAPDSFETLPNLYIMPQDLNNPVHYLGASAPPVGDNDVLHSRLGYEMLPSGEPVPLYPALF